MLSIIFFILSIYLARKHYLLVSGIREALYERRGFGDYDYERGLKGYIKLIEEKGSQALVTTSKELQAFFGVKLTNLLFPDLDHEDLIEILPNQIYQVLYDIRSSEGLVGSGWVFRDAEAVARFLDHKGIYYSACGISNYIAHKNQTIAKISKLLNYTGLKKHE